ncbi:MAG: tetratricopeptide repeat protein [Desulfatibacillaceae bacterium]|nr:tetratricopeptide repeat protein [Desulfatibacillaceae bacterium]
MKKLFAAVVFLCILAPQVWADPYANQNPQWVKLNASALALFQEKEFEKASRAYEDIIKFLESKNLTQGVEATIAYNNAGMLYLILQDFPKSQENLTRSLHLRTTIFGENSLETATVLKNLGDLFQTQAQLFFEKSGQIMQALEGGSAQGSKP